MKTAALKKGEKALLYFPGHPEHLTEVLIVQGFGAHRINDGDKVCVRIGYMAHTASQGIAFMFAHHLRRVPHQVAHLRLVVDNRAAA